MLITCKISILRHVYFFTFILTSRALVKISLNIFLWTLSLLLLATASYCYFGKVVWLWEKERACVVSSFCIAEKCKESKTRATVQGASRRLIKNTSQDPRRPALRSLGLMVEPILRQCRHFFVSTVVLFNGWWDGTYYGKRGTYFSTYCDRSNEGMLDR